MIGTGSNRGEAVRELLDTASGRVAPDLIIEGGRLVNVHTAEILPAGVAVKGGRIASVGGLEKIRKGPGTKVVSANGKYLVPGFIDPHLHVYHACQNITEIAKLLVLHGTTAVADSLYGPALISIEALKFYLEEFRRTPVRLIWLAPVMVYLQNRVIGLKPVFDTVRHEDLLAMLGWPECHGLEEPDATLMVEDRPEDMLAAHEAALKAGLTITGHAWNLNEADLNAYAAIGASSDHEGETVSDALERSRLGLWVHIRHGAGVSSAAEMVKALTEHKADPRFFSFCADLIDTGYLMERGDIDEAVRVAVGHGVNPVTAIQMATINAAESLGLGRELGSLAPGKLADILLLDDLASVKISRVFTNGQEVVRNGKLVLDLESPEYPEFLRQSVRIKRPVEPADFAVRAGKASGRAAVRVIEVRGDSLHMPEGRAELEVRDGLVQPDPGGDVLKIALVEANRLSGDVGLGFVRGFGLRQGALATTHNPFFHGLAVVGTNDEDMAAAANELARAGGGQAVVAGGEVKAMVRLPLSGVLSDRPYRENIKEFERLAAAARELGCPLPSAFKTLGFTTATGNIGDLKLSDQGLVDVSRRRLTGLLVD